jgi:hypothetical protein
MRTPKPKQPISPKSIARHADEGQDISRYFTNKGKMMPRFGNVGIDPNQNSAEGIEQDCQETPKTVEKR